MKKSIKGAIAFLALAAVALVFIQGCSKSGDSASPSTEPKFTLKSEYRTN